MPQPGIGHALQARWGSAFTTVSNVVILVSFLPNSLSVGVVQPFRGSVNFRFESYKHFGVAPGTYPHTITLCQANAFIFPIADLCTILLTALLAMYGRRIMYAIIDIILRGTDLTFLPEEAFYDGFCDFRLCDAIAQGALLSRTAIELCAEPYPCHPVLTPHSCTGRVQQSYPDGHYSEQTPYTGHAGQLALQPSYQPPDSSLRPVH